MGHWFARMLERCLYRAFPRYIQHIFNNISNDISNDPMISNVRQSGSGDTEAVQPLRG